MAIAEANQTTLNKGSVRIPRNTGKLATQRKRFELTADPASEYAGAFSVAMDEMMVVEAASAILEKALNANAALNYRAVVEGIANNIVTVGVQVVLTGAELGAVDLAGYTFVVEAEGY